ncbi:hypothetical protein FH972_023444 [Carpinus fangiana]|uniref:J domain-containing protein n=1 Tax=Carpinus fangiana TaxID=176857 RepID=A0A5N6KVG1_9ROSI|nr:hypothetical protein FH972_023444 [Carpinus fangiana]
MSKVDPTQDYYAALDVAHDAGDDEIRKSYRKLALKLHPDRHPGKEAEFQPRFQQIQAAHECLTDPDQRRKYDLSRKRPFTSSTSARPGPSGQRGNPYKASSAYPPPPTPPGARPRKKDGPAPPPRGGAERYTSFPNPPPRRAPDAAKSDAKSRANVFNAWQNMNNAQKTTQAQRTQGYRGVPPAWDGPRVDPEAAGRSAYDTVNGQQQQQQRPSSSRTNSSSHVPPRPRYHQDPPTPSGDDSSTSRTRDRPFGRTNPPRMSADFPPRVPPRPAPTAKRPEGASGGTPRDDAPFTEGSRERTPYSSGPAGQTSFFGSADSIRRTASVRDATKLDPTGAARVDSRTGRHRSMSPTSRAGDSRDASRDGPRSTRPSNSRRSSGRPFHSYSSSSDASSEDDMTPPRRASYTPAGQPNPANRPKATPATSWQKRRENPPALNKARSFDGPSHVPSGQDDPDAQSPRPKSSIFNLRVDSDGPANATSAGATHRRFQEPNTQFSPTDGRPPVFSPPPPNTGSPRHAESLDFSAYQSRRSHGHDHASSAAPGHVASDGDQSPDARRDFRAEGWQQAFESDGNWASRWAHAPSGSTSTSPTRNQSNIGRRARHGLSRNPSRVPPSAGATTTESVQQNLEEGNAPPMSAAIDADDAMDIDNTPPPTSRRPSVIPDSGSEVSSSAAASAAPRHVFVEPARPEWRTSTMNGSRRPSASAQDQGIDPSTLPPPPPGGPPLSAPARSGPNISLDSFRHVLPGPSNGAGIRNMADLHSTLPFESRAASSQPLRSPELKAAEAMPKPPLAPLVPSTLTKAHWETYLAQMTDYMTKWNSFNARMVAHFQDQAVALADFSLPHAGAEGGGAGVVDGWLGAVGETGLKKGWDSYVRQLRMDEQWRIAWSVACERHVEAVERHGGVRARLLGP